MCDVSSTRKPLVVLLSLLLLQQVLSEAQLNLPPYNQGGFRDVNTYNGGGYNTDLNNPNYNRNLDRNDLNYARGLDRNIPVNTNFDRVNPNLNTNTNFDRTNPNYDRNNPNYDRNNPTYDRNNPTYDRNNVPNGNFDRSFNRNPIFERNDPDKNVYDVNNRINPDRNNPNFNLLPDRRQDGNFPRPPVANAPPYHGGDIRALLQALDVQASQQCTNNVAAQWNFETNVNQATQLDALNAQQLYSEFQHGVWDLLNKVDNINLIPDDQTYRQIRYLSVVGPAALPPDQLDRYNRLINDMLAIYNTASICALTEPFNCGLRLQPDLVTIMARSRNWEELQHIWTEWRRNTGMKIKDTYEQIVHISNEAARLNNFTDTAEYWSFPFESPALSLDLEDAWEEIKPLYELLHAYVRRRLRDYYGPDKVSRQAPLPAHILGNMWAQSWSNIFDISQPYPGQHFLDVTPEMVRQGYTPVDLFRLSEDFFVSMNMSAMPLDFWGGSILEEPLDRTVLCQPSAWDFCNRRDYRIKMCGHVNMKDLITAHHEMAHIQYFMMYKNLPKVFRDGANPAFHEAIGEAIGLSVGTPKHLQALGLVQSSVDDSAVDINYLYSMALEKVVFLPFAYVMDKWRYGVFKGEINKDQYNCHWWRLSEQYMGIKPPVLRSEMDFDPGAKYHIPANIPYLRYFVSTLLQFQIYRALCKASGQYVQGDPYKPLHKCDIYRSKEAGRILMQIMEKGASQPWRDILFQATGESRLDGSAMREYFHPLEEWLRNENLRTQEFVGWLYDGDYCKQSIETAGLQVYGGFYNHSYKTRPFFKFYSLILCSLILFFLSAT